MTTKRRTTRTTTRRSTPARKRPPTPAQVRGEMFWLVATLALIAATVIFVPVLFAAVQ